MVSLRKQLLLYCLLFICITNAQSILKAKIDSIQEFKDVKLKIEGFEAILTQQDTLAKTKELGMLYHELGSSYYRNEDYGKAISFFDNAINIYIVHNDILKANESRYWLSRVYNKSKNIEQENKVLKDIIDETEGNEFTGYAYRYLAKNERNIGDFSRALYYLNLGLANKELCKDFMIENGIRFEIINTYAKKYESTSNVNEANHDLKIIQKQETLILVDSLNIRNTPVINNNLAVLYDAFGDLKKALHYYEKSLNYFQVYDDKYQELKVVNNVGIIYSKQKKHVLANAFYKKVLKESDDEEQIATAYDNMGYYMPETSAKDKIPYFQKAIHTILERKGTASTSFKLPALSEIKNSGYQLEILPYLIDLISHYVKAYNEEQDDFYLSEAKETAYLIDNLISFIRYQTNAEASKLFWIRKGVNTYMLAVEVCYLLNDPASAFFYMEKNKALLLQENIKTLQAKLKLNIPEDLVKREHQLHYKMLAIEEQIHQNTEDEAWKAAYTKTHEEYQMFMDSIQYVYPEYVKTKQKVAITSLEDTVKAFTEKKESFVEYILHEADGYGIYYDSGKPIFFKINNTPKFQEKLEILKAFLTRRSLKNEELQKYQEVGYAVFKKLFPFENAAERLQNKKLTIVADQALQYIPFEILPIRKDGELVENYLVNNVETSYLQSFSLFDQIQRKQNKPTQKLLTIAPEEFQDAQLPTLTGTENIVKLVANFDKSIVLTKQEASKANFLKQQKNFEIIYFNTHAGLDSITQKPWIAFHEDKMTLNELFGLENQADLVILDACQTNDGINISGEGVINLSRGFFYNGTQSVVASLWSVNEQAGNKILQTFYRELASGTSKSKALQLAKKEYLKQHQFSQNEPYYWAAFTLTGSTNSIEIHTQSYQYYIVFAIVLSIIIAIFLIYRKRKNYSNN